MRTVFDRLSRARLACAACFLALGAQSPAQTRSERFDVVIVSGSSAGVGAALGAGRMGASVALIEDTPVLGGMLANGISNIDAYSLESLSGVFDEFRLRVQEHYRPIMASDPIFRSRMRMPRHVDGRSRAANDAEAGGRWEPHVADEIFKDLVARVPQITVFYNRWPTGVIKQGNRVIAVNTDDARGDQRTFFGKVVIDATHEGDIAAWAGAAYRIGREARSPLEPHAGDIYFFDGTGEIMDGGGQQDRAVVSYGLRLTIQHYSDRQDSSHILQTPPPGYNKSEYERSAYDAAITMPHGKAEMNANPIGNEIQEINWEWPEATRQQRQRLYQIYKNHALGFLYYLQHERGRTDLGLPKDEFPDNGNVPYRVFVREARRIVGVKTMTEADINPFLTGRGWIPPLREDAIAIGHYPIDSKPVKSKTDFSRPDKGAGDFYIVNVTTPFQVPFGAIVPEKIDGLLVPAALSASHVAFSAIRMDPTWTVLGQAAGVAAALSARLNMNVRSVPVEQIQRELLRQKCKLMFYWDLPAEHPAFAAVEWLSLRSAVTGYPDRLFRPDQSLTRAEMAALLVKAFQLWPSVSDVHFTDVAPTHWAFREIETLFDNRALVAFGVRPRWPEAGAYNPARDEGFAASKRSGEFLPARPVLWKELAETLWSIWKPHNEASTGDPSSWIKSVLQRSMFGAPYAGRDFPAGALVTRGEACALVASLSDDGAN